MSSGPRACISFYRPAAVLRVTGEDALPFLQGQFTQELRVPPGPLCAYGLWLNQKGKVVADSFALRDGENWWLISMTSLASRIRERLEAYIIADDVALEDCTESWHGAVVVGHEATSRLMSKEFLLPSAGEWASIAGGLVFRGRRGAGDSWEWLGPRDLGAPRDILGGGIEECSTVDLERSRIRARIPSVPADVGSSDLPNEAGLEAIAVSYSKGCYLGQEVMARLKSMGQVRRRLLGVCGAGTPPACPAAIYAGPKKVGEIRTVVAGEEANTFVGLAMVSLLGLDTTRRLSLEADGPPTVEVFQDPS